MPITSSGLVRSERRLRTRQRIVYRSNRTHDVLRRIRDITLASAGILATAPILALAAIAIKIEDGGPIVFTQQRVGKFERLFTIYKLRTMQTAHCVDGVSPTSSQDARITAVGRFLRRTSIDELPQLFNILRGEMTLVGPRPEMPFIVARYARFQHLRHLVTPGLTGLWQIKHRSTLALARLEATAVDLEYIHNASPAYDLRMIVQTVATVIRLKGAY